MTLSYPMAFHKEFRTIVMGRHLDSRQEITPSLLYFRRWKVMQNCEATFLPSLEGENVCGFRMLYRSHLSPLGTLARLWTKACICLGQWRIVKAKPARYRLKACKTNSLSFVRDSIPIGSRARNHQSTAMP